MPSGWATIAGRSSLALEPFAQGFDTHLTEVFPQAATQADVAAGFFPLANNHQIRHLSKCAHTSKR